MAASSGVFLSFLMLGLGIMVEYTSIFRFWNCRRRIIITFLVDFGEMFFGHAVLCGELAAQKAALFGMPSSSGRSVRWGRRGGLPAGPAPPCQRPRAHRGAGSGRGERGVVTRRDVDAERMRSENPGGRERGGRGENKGDLQSCAGFFKKGPDCQLV